MDSKDIYTSLATALQNNASAIRFVTRLQPAGGAGDKLFPPTYPTDDKNVQYAIEKRLIDSDLIDCVLIDSVQSQANRMELALQAAIDSGRLALPLIETTVKHYGRVTVFQAPHRLYDAILRDSELNGVRFWESDLGKRLMAARTHAATPIYAFCPQLLLFGGWHSQAGSGGRGAKIQRALSSEIIGLQVQSGLRPSSRIDPLGIQKEAGPVYKAADASRQWTLEEDQAEHDPKTQKPIRYGKKDKTGNPSNIGHGNVTPSLMLGGVTVSEARQIAVLSLPALRRLSFPDEHGEVSIARDQAGQTVIATLGLVALMLQLDQGFDLRSRCLLVPDSAPDVALLGRYTSEQTPLILDTDTALETLQLAVDAATAQGLSFTKEPLQLTAIPELNSLMERSLQIEPAETEEG